MPGEALASERHGQVRGVTHGRGPPGRSGRCRQRQAEGRAQTDQRMVLKRSWEGRVEETWIKGTKVLYLPALPWASLSVRSFCPEEDHGLTWVNDT